MSLATKRVVGSTNPFALYTALDLNDALGTTYGPQMLAPTAPSGFTDVTANNTTELQDYLNSTSPLRITTVAGVNYGSVVCNLDDGVDNKWLRHVRTATIASLSIGKLFDTGSTSSLFRLSGETLGTPSGGDITSLRLGSFWNDGVHIDGVRCLAVWNSGFVSHGLDFQALAPDGMTRIAVTNTRILSGGAGLLGQGRYIVIAGCSILSGTEPLPRTGRPESWPARITPFGTSRVVVSHSILETNLYHCLRIHPGADDCAVGVLKNRLVNMNESRMLVLRSDMDSQTGVARLFRVKGNESFLTGTATGVGAGYEFGEYQSAETVEFIGNRFNSRDSMSDTNLTTNQKSGVTQSVTKTGNTYVFDGSTLPTVPSWTSTLWDGTTVGAGDPNSAIS